MYVSNNNKGMKKESAKTNKKLFGGVRSCRVWFRVWRSGVELGGVGCGVCGLWR